MRRRPGRWRAGRGWLPVPHWPSVRGRARADAGPLLLVAAVVAAVTLLAGGVPPQFRATADEAVQDAVRRAGDDSDIVVHVDLGRDDGPNGGRVRAPHLAEDVDDSRTRAADELGPGLRAVLHPPIASVTGPTLKITDGSVLRTFRLAYLAKDPGAGGGPRVTWIAGGPPRSSVSGADSYIEAPSGGKPWPVQVGLSEAGAGALGVRPGARIPLADERGNIKNVRVSGIFRAADGADPAWRLAPSLLRPVPGADGVGTTRFTGLLSADSLPDARLAFGQGELERTIRLTPDPDRLTWDSSRVVAAKVVSLKAASGAGAGSVQWETRLDAVLRDVAAKVGAASAQASVLLIGVLTATVLLLLLAADLLARRRAPALAAARQRGAALPVLAAELLLESAVVVLSAAAAGLVLARAVAAGVSWQWAVPVVFAAAVAGPAFGTLAAAGATRDRRVPANRSARRWARHTVQLRRAALEITVLIAALAAFVTLLQRGILPEGAAGPELGPGSGGVLPASAPALGVLAGTLVLLRLLPAATRLALARAQRTRRPLAVFGAARVAATSARVLPLLLLTSSVALASFALSLDATVGQGLADGAWRTVGADARLDVAPAAAASTPALARRIAAAPGVRQVVAAQVSGPVRLAGSPAVAARLVIVDASAYRKLLAATPLPDAPALDRLATPVGGGVPALVGSDDGSLRPGMRLELPREGAPSIRLAAIGPAPAIGDAAGVVVGVVVVDAGALAAAGLPSAPNTVWANGPGAARAVAASAAAGKTVLRANVLHAGRAAPLTAGLLRLAWVSVAILLAGGLLGLALGAAASAPDRWLTLTRLRTLGLRPREARWIAVGELLPPVLVAAVTGTLLGVLLVHLTLGALGLRLLTGQSADPALVLPWWRLGAVSAVLPAAVAVVVPVESALRRRRRLGEVLRAGDG